MTKQFIHLKELESLHCFLEDLCIGLSKTRYIRPGNYLYDLIYAGLKMVNQIILTCVFLQHLSVLDLLARMSL